MASNCSISRNVRWSNLCRYSMAHLQLVASLCSKRPLSSLNCTLSCSLMPNDALFLNFCICCSKKTSVSQQGGQAVKRQSIEYFRVVLLFYNYHYHYRFPQLHLGSKQYRACAVSSMWYSYNGNARTIMLW